MFQALDEVHYKFHFSPQYPYKMLWTKKSETKGYQDPHLRSHTKWQTGFKSRYTQMQSPCSIEQAAKQKAATSQLSYLHSVFIKHVLSARQPAQGAGCLAGTKQTRPLLAGSSHALSPVLSLFFQAWKRTRTPDS